MENNPTYHIIGAGIAGLYSAKVIKEQNPNAKVVLYDAAEKIGGRCASVFSKQFDCMIDNATHVVLNCNKNTSTIIDKHDNLIKFWNLQNNKFINKINCLKEIELAVFNTENADWKCRLFALKKLFPFLRIKSFFSTGNLENVLCKPLCQYVDEFKYGYVWKGINSDNKHISELIFKQNRVKVADKDIVISAIDSFNYNKIFGGYDFEYNTITNVFYRTSMALTLPKKQKILGIIKGKSQWIFAGNNYIAITISNARDDINVNEIWQEICKIRNYNSAFLPKCIVLNYNRATIKQDYKNNNLRPTSACIMYDNMFICGDWTMKNRPCCIETAIESAIRIGKIFSK